MADPAQTPTCPFCEAPWTTKMLERLEQNSSAAVCACCAENPASGHAGGPLKLPTQDLACDSCGKSIYRAPADPAAMSTRARSA